MGLFTVFFLLILLFVVEILYFKIANKFNIIDKPNHRSSHSAVTIRGGGIIFSIALLSVNFYLGFQYIFFVIGLLLISAVSFIDDIKPTPNKIRITIHLIAVALMFYQLGLYNQPIYLIGLGLFFVIGSINAINFMDGINGITGGFGLITLLTLYYINKYVVQFTNGEYLIIAGLSIIVFNFFNFRTKAKCFAGDVGSVSLAFIILFFLLQLILKTGNLNYLLLLLIYGLDTVTTIFFRLLKKEDIFQAHRSHFYQFLANEKKMLHLVVAAIYIVTQSLINFLIIKFNLHTISGLFIVIILTSTIFISVRLYFEGANKLLKNATQ